MARTHLDDWPPVVTVQRWYRAVFTPERLGSERFMMICWLTVRLVTFLPWAFLPNYTHSDVQGDVRYYYSRIMAMDIVGPQYTMQEYPTPVLWFLMVPRILGGGTSTGYVIAYALLMLSLDAAFSFSMWRSGGRYRGAALIFWNAFILVLGPLAYMRFDLVTSVLAGWSLLSVQRRRPAWAGALIGAGAAVKLWPALMWPALFGGRRRGNLMASLGVFATGGVLALASVLWAGWNRLLSPLTWQSDRGLQIESIWATIPMALRALGIGTYHVANSRYQAYEIWGPGVNGWLSAASIAFDAGVIAAVIVYIVWLLRPREQRHISDSVALMLLVVLLMIVANKTFSPQYIQWLSGPLAAGIVVAGLARDTPQQDRAHVSRLKRICVALLTLALLTQVIFPIGYFSLVNATPWMLPVTVILVVRNVGMLWLLGRVIGWVWQSIRHRPRTANGQVSNTLPD